LPPRKMTCDGLWHCTPPRPMWSWYTEPSRK
jgi:hypothetical protein